MVAVGCEAGRPCGAHASAQGIGAEHTIFIGIQGFSRPDHAIPPVDHIRIPRQCVFYHDEVIAVEGSPCLVSDGDIGNGCASFGYKLADVYFMQRSRGVEHEASFRGLNELMLPGQLGLVEYAW